MRTPEADVLVTSGQSRIGLNVARSLGRAGLRVVLGAPVPFSVGFASRYVSGSFVHPWAGRTPEAFADAVVHEVDRWRPKLMIPADDASLAVLARTRERLEPRVRVACPPFEVVRQVLDKEATLSLAARLDIPIPRTRTLDHGQLQDPGLADFRFPVIVKPRLKRLEGELNKVKVLYCPSRATLERHLGEQSAVRDWLLQEYVPGVGVGLGVLARAGEPVVLFQYRRLRDLPPGGISVLRVSEPVDPRLEEYARRLLGALGWDGVAMVEFRMDEQRRPVLMEVNGRFWGGLALALVAGMDFPLWLYRYAVDGELPPTQPVYRAGVRCRWLVGEVERLEYVLRGRAGNDPMDQPTRLKAIWDFAATSVTTRHYDEFLFGDIHPGLKDLWQCTGRRVWRAARQRVQDLRGWFHGATVRWIQRLGGLERWRRNVVPSVSRSILFVCHGNICRSPFAARYLHTRLEALGWTGISVRSAGLSAVPGREADPLTARAAKEFGVDLWSHLAEGLSAQIVRESDLILVMEWAHRVRLLEAFPDARGKTVLLGMFDEDLRDLNIADPGHAPFERHRACQRRIMACVDGVLGHLRC